MLRLASPDRRPAALSHCAALLAVAALALPCAAGAANRFAPTISGTPPTSDVVGSPYSFTPNASDADGNRLRFSILNAPAWATFDTRTGRLAGTPAAAGTWSGISIAVNDSKYSAALAPFQIVVSAPAASAPPVQAPSISGTPPTSARVGQAYAFTPSAQDPQGLPLTYAIVNKPVWAGFSTTTGALQGTPGSADVGLAANVTISASNGTATSSLAPFSIDVQQASMGSATLSWQPPTTRTDGTALTNLSGYRIYYGTSPGNYPNSVALANPGLSSYVIDNLPPGTYYFVITAVDANGLESAYSNSANKSVT